MKDKIPIPGSKPTFGERVEAAKTAIRRDREAGLTYLGEDQGSRPARKLELTSALSRGSLIFIRIFQS